ncbi:MAG: hypothetical protein RLZZ141_275 [Pseudomonadota bacterium]
MTPDLEPLPDDQPLDPIGAATDKPISAAAMRALEEAAARRAEAEAITAAPERNGPKGPEPTRFGDWERKGIAVDF